MLTAWLLFPLVLAALCQGWGWALALATRVGVPAAATPCLGMAGLVVAGQFLTLADATAELATPVLAAVGVIGLALGVVRRLAPPPRWALVAAAGVFAVYAAPIVLSGEATFAGYIKLDDTATWMAFTDRVMEHGRSLEGLAPSTYEATLAFNIGDGYPAGVFVPLGVATHIVGEDVAWLVQPYMAFWAALLALALYALGRRAVRGPRARAVTAFVAAQPALLFGYYLWGGIKEVAAIALIASAAALVPVALRRGPGAVLPLAVVAGGLVGVLSLGGLVWLCPLLLAGLVLAARRLGLRATVGRAVALAAVSAVAAVPVMVAGGLVPPTSAPLTAGDAVGNLGDPLEAAQVAGLWPVGDFRDAPDPEFPAYVAVGLACLAAAVGVAAAWLRGAWWAAAFVAGTLLAALMIWLVGSPWVDGKALATASVAIPFAALIGAFAAWTGGRRVLGAAVAILVALGVAWSNALAYRDVSLAPRDRLAELETIGDRIGGEGPTLSTEYEPYGARHFLREGDPEGVSELRRRTIALAGGGTVPKGESADTDELAGDSLLVYNALVLRRSPVRSRPPALYERTWRGRYYELWQRPQAPVRVERLPLGSGRDPGATPACSDVMGLARSAAPSQELLAARALNPLPARLSASGEATADVPRQGSYSAWVLGSIRGEATLYADGEEVGRARHELNHEGGFVELGNLQLPVGQARLRLEPGGGDVHPGSGGHQPPLDLLVLAPNEPERAGIVRVPPHSAKDLCGRRWDWIELGPAVNPSLAKPTR